MKNKIKAIAAAIAAITLIGTASIGASATTADDVVAAARGAGFLEEYVQMLQSFLNTTHYNSDQYDTMIGMLSSAGEDMDKVALDYFGKTIAQMKGEAQDKADQTGDPVDIDDFLNGVVDHMKDDDVVTIIDKIISTGKELGLDITAEKKGDKNYIITIKDKDGNVQFVAPIGKLIDRTGAEEADGINAAAAAAAGTAVASGCIGIAVLAVKAKKNEE